MTVICKDMTVNSLDKVIVQFSVLDCDLQGYDYVFRDGIVQFSVHDCHLQAYDCTLF